MHSRASSTKPYAYSLNRSLLKGIAHHFELLLKHRDENHILPHLLIFANPPAAVPKPRTYEF